MRWAGPGATRAKLTRVDLPDFGMPEAMPGIPDAVYAARLDRLRTRADQHGYDRVIVYADREHSASLAYLTGFDPRFEEVVLVVAPSADPAILVGNECYGMAGAAPMLSAGPRASLGLLSPTDRRIERGDRFTVAFGIWGALNCRAGWATRSSASS